MKSAVLSQQCTKTEFGEGFYLGVLQEGQSVMINFISYLTEEGARGVIVFKALRYKPAGRWFDCRWCHWNFSVT